MRLIPFILLVIGFWGLFYPQTLLAADRGGGRWVFCLILLLAGLSFWRMFLKRR